MVTTAALVVAAPWHGPVGRESLTPAQDPVVPTPVETARADPAPVALTAPAPTTGAAPVGTTPVPRSATEPTASATTRPAAPAAPASSPIRRGTATIASGDLCQDDAVDAAQGWCVRYTGPATARRGSPVALSGALCRLATRPAGSVRFATTREVLIAVSGGSAQWQAGQGERYSSPGRTVSVAPGSCLTWSSTWDTRDKDGFLVTPGTYDVMVRMDSNDLTTTVAAQLDVTD